MLLTIALLAIVASPFQTGSSPEYVDVYNDVEFTSGPQSAGGLFGLDGAEWKDGSKPTPDYPDFSATCPTSITIYVPGYNNDEGEQVEQTEDLQEALDGRGVDTEVVGFKWNGNPPGLLGFTAFDSAKESANINAEILCEFVEKLKEDCPDTKVFVVTHSLGARVALKALDCGACIDGCFLYGPAVPKGSVEPGGTLGPPQGGSELGDEWGTGAEPAGPPEVKVWFNPKDWVLGFPYFAEERNYPLGGVGGKAYEHPDNGLDNLSACNIWGYYDGWFFTKMFHGKYLEASRALDKLAESINQFLVGGNQ